MLTDATADLALALMLAAARRLPAARDAARAGGWRTWEPQGWLGLELPGARLVIVGAGRIGRAVAAARRRSAWRSCSSGATTTARRTAPAPTSSRCTRR